MKKEIIKLTKELVNFESTSDNLKERQKIIDFIIFFINSNTKNATIKQFKAKNPVSNQIISSIHVFNPDMNKNKSVLLLGHVDVVPGDSFNPTNNEKFIFGRGSGDMKSGVAISILLFLKHHKNKNIQLLITNDEEIGGHGGAGFISKKIKPDFVIAPEPTNLDLRIKEKGAMQIQIEVQTSGGHSSRPWKNLNSIEIMLNLISQLKKAFKNPLREKWVNTINIGGIIGGNIKDSLTLGSSNIIANSCKIKLDLRLVDTCSHKNALNLIQESVKKIESKLKQDINHMNLENNNFKIIINNPDILVEHLITNKNNSFVKSLSKSIKTKFGVCNITKAPAASDARFFSSVGIPSVVFGANSINHHANNEHVQISSLLNVWNILNHFLTTY